MPTETVVSALQQEDALCDQALLGLSDWLAVETRVPLRHPLTAACSVILRHIDTEENIVFPRLLLRAPEHAALIKTLTKEHDQLRTELTRIETLVMAEQREPARQALAGLRQILSTHTEHEQPLISAITECLIDPNEVGHLFHSGYFRGKFDPFKFTV